jgi:hypothetical protein
MVVCNAPIPAFKMLDLIFEHQAAEQQAMGE